MGPVIQIEKPRANHRLARMSTCHVAQLPLIQKSEVEAKVEPRLPTRRYGSGRSRAL